MFDGIEVLSGAKPTHSVIRLHGLGADGRDFEPLVPQLVRQDWPAIRFVFPHAPVRAVTINNGMRMRAWYDIRGASIADREDAEGVRESVATVERLITREAEKGIALERIFIAGFSQGGAVALATTVRRAAPLAGTIALSCYLPLAGVTATEIGSDARNVPIFMAHGSHDPVVPQSLGERSREWLVQADFKVDWHTYPMQHSLCADEVHDLATWLTSRLSVA